MVVLLLGTDLLGQGALLVLLLADLLQVDVVLDVAVGHDHLLEGRDLLGRLAVLDAQGDAQLIVECWPVGGSVLS